MALRTTNTFTRTLLAGAALLLSAFTATTVTARPAFATTHHYRHHHLHGFAQNQLVAQNLPGGAAHHAVTRHRLHHFGPGMTFTSASLMHPVYDDGAGYQAAAPYRHHYRLRAARYRHSGLQCVPYAREISHIDLSGDAFLWWAEASGRYARGNVPVQGAVLNFRAIGRMPLGHVAVVTAVEDNRTILVTQANWVRGSITNDVTIQDVSPANDWSQVKVELGDSSTWGAPYPTYGFIYNKPDTGTVIAANGQRNEVAEAPALTQVSDEAPDRNLQ